VTEDEKTAVSTAVSELEAATKENDVEDIKAKTEALQNILMPITQRAYEQAQQAGGAEGFDPNAFQGGDAGQQKADDGVVDVVSLKKPRLRAVFFIFRGSIYFHTTHFSLHYTQMKKKNDLCIDLDSSYSS